MQLKYVCTVVCFCVLAAQISFAQATVNYASLAGRVTDPSGAVVAGARVTARQTDTNLISSAETGPDGRFRFPYLKVGPYEVKIQQPGFADSIRLATLTVGASFELPVMLTLAPLQVSEQVESDAAILDAVRTQIEGTVSAAEVRSLPLNGRSFLDLALLIPGVSPTNTASNQLFAETSAVPGQGLSIGSQRNFSNNFIVDGLSANDDAAGLSGFFYGLDVVQEFQVVTSGGQAELGRALGGYINMVTKSGTNTLHGDLYGYFRNQRLNAANPLLHAKLPATQAQYGASLGGPIIRDRTFYFANCEQRLLNQSGLITILPENAAAINARLSSVGYRGPLLLAGLYPNPVDSENFLAKVDHQFSSKDQVSLRYSMYKVHSLNSRGAGALNAVTAAANLDDLDQTVAIGNVATLSARTVNETRAQFTRSSLQAPPTDPIGPAVSIAGVASLGTLSGSPTARIADLYELADSLSHQVGPHTFRAGVDFLDNESVITYPRSVRGSYAFSSLAAFLQGTYNNLGFAQTFGPSSISQNNPNLGLFAQDEWKLSSRLTLNLGVRYDLQFLDSIATDTNNVSPRAGFAWTPFASRQTVIRGSFGLFYDRVPLRALANALLSAGNTSDLAKLRQIGITLSPGQTGAPVFPDILNTLTPSSSLPNFTTMNPHMQNAYSEQSSVGIEQQIGARGTFSVQYQHLRGLHLIAAVNQNVPTCVASGANNGCRPNSSYANNSQYSPAGDSRFNALNLSFVQRPSSWGSYRISYSYSKALDDVGEFFFSAPIDNFNIWQDWGRSDDDQRHRITVDGVVHSHGFEWSGMLQCYSALPLNITSGVTTVQGTAGRPIVNGAFLSRNAGVGNDFFSLGTRLRRTFSVTERVKLDAMAEAFNLLNRRNNLTMNGTFGSGAYPSSPSSSFGQITAVNDARVVQLVLRMGF